MDYEGFAIKCRGASHIEKDLPCQDAAEYIQRTQFVAASIADGHGSQRYFRSDRGSSMAAKIACEKADQFLSLTALSDLKAEEQELKIHELINSIIAEWQIAVQNDIISNPFTERELETIPQTELSFFSAFSEVETNNRSNYEREQMLKDGHHASEIHRIYSAYGTTLICLGVCTNYAFGIQIGDGKCVVLNKDGTICEPIPWDDKCHLNQCTSICDKTAEKEFRFYIWNNNIPVALFCASDGIDDTFADQLHSFYLKILLDLSVSDFREQIRSLEEQLPEITSHGSKDDLSIAGIVNKYQLSQMEPVIQTLLRQKQNEAKIETEKQKLTELQFRYERTLRIMTSCAEEAKEKISQYQKKIEQLQTEIEETKSTIEQLSQPEADNIQKQDNPDEVQSNHQIVANEEGDCYEN